MRNCATRGGRCRSRRCLQPRQAARQRTPGGANERRGERAQKRHRQKGELKTGVEELIGVEQQEAQRHRRQQVQRAPLAKKIAGHGHQRQPRGRADAGRAPARHQRVEPGRRHRERQRRALRHEAQPQQEQEERRQNRHVGSGNHQRVEGAGIAVAFGPDALQLVLLAQQQGLHHARRGTRRRLVKPLDAMERAGAQVHGEFPIARAAAARQACAALAAAPDAVQ